MELRLEHIDFENTGKPCSICGSTSPYIRFSLYLDGAPIIVCEPCVYALDYVDSEEVDNGRSQQYIWRVECGNSRRI